AVALAHVRHAGRPVAGRVHGLRRAIERVRPQELLLVSALGLRDDPTWCAARLHRRLGLDEADARRRPAVPGASGPFPEARHVVLGIGGGMDGLTGALV